LDLNPLVHYIKSLTKKTKNKNKNKSEPITV
jgi:hypothetical protein